MNRAKLSADLRRRSIPINLEFLGPVRDREFSIAQLEDFVLAHRIEIQGEIVGIVSRWLEDGCPMRLHSDRRSMSRTWAATIDSILRSCGFVGFWTISKHPSTRSTPITRTSKKSARSAPTTPGDARDGQGACLTVDC